MFYKSIFFGAVALLLSVSAQASLVGDEIFGTGHGIAGLSESGVVVSDNFSTPHEFTGNVTGVGGLVFEASFNFTTQSMADMLLLDFGPASSSGGVDTLDFHVIFSDLNWDGEPNRILTGLSLVEDDNGSFGQGFTGTVDDHSFTLNFTNFFVNSFRSMEIELLTEIDSSPSNPDPVPVPPALGLGLMGMGLVGLTRRARQHNNAA